MKRFALSILFIILFTLGAAAQENAPVRGVSFTGQGPLGVELVRTQGSNVGFELLGIDRPADCFTEARLDGGILCIAVRYAPKDGANVMFGPENDYRNVVRVSIPDAEYDSFDLQIERMVLVSQDFHAPVHVTAVDGGFSLVDDTISRGTYDIDVTNGPLELQARVFLQSITAAVHAGPIELHFLEQPQNLLLDTTACTPLVRRPATWPALCKIGNASPSIVLCNENGPTNIEVP